MRYKTISKSEIEEEMYVCPYCGNVTEIEPTRLCCGELHAEKAYILKGDDGVYLDSEVIFKD